MTCVLFSEKVIVHFTFPSLIFLAREKVHGIKKAKSAVPLKGKFVMFPVQPKDRMKVIGQCACIYTFPQ